MVPIVVADSDVMVPLIRGSQTPWTYVVTRHVVEAISLTSSAGT
jgi:hypothetical protein